MLPHLQHFGGLVLGSIELDKCCKMIMQLQKPVLIGLKTAQKFTNILADFINITNNCQNLAIWADWIRLQALLLDLRTLILVFLVATAQMTETESALRRLEIGEVQMMDQTGFFRRSREYLSEKNLTRLRTVRFMSCLP